MTFGRTEHFGSVPYPTRLSDRGRYILARPRDVRQFRKLMEDGGMEVIRLPPLSPNLNAALCSLDQGRVPESDDLRGVGLTASRGC